MDVPSAVFALVLAETAAGGLVLLALSSTWGVTRRGFQILLVGTLGLMAVGAWGALGGPVGVLREADALPAVMTSAVWSRRVLLATAGLAGACVVALVARATGAGRLLGVASALAGVGALVPLALIRSLRGAPGGFLQGFAELALGAFLLGAVWNSLILGHWYLVQRRLSNHHMEWISWANVAAVVGGVVAVLLSTRNPVPCAGLAGRELELCVFQFSPLLTVGNLTLLMGLGTLALVGLVAAFNVRLAREGGRSIQAATGMSYLAVILAPAAEFAAKVRFF